MCALEERSSVSVLLLTLSELEKIAVPGEDVYLPTDPRQLVRGIVTDSGIALQSAKKVPIMVTFTVVQREEAEEGAEVDETSLHRQACIFKVGVAKGGMQRNACIECGFRLCLTLVMQTYQ